MIPFFSKIFSGAFFGKKSNAGKQKCVFMFLTDVLNDFPGEKILVFFYNHIIFERTPFELKFNFDSYFLSF